MKVINTTVPVSFYQKVVIYLVLIVFTVQPALAKVVVSGKGNTHIETAANGVEVVNIATPNRKGLSHNQYHQFDVAPSGLVLNNSTEQFKQSQLAGILQNNPNLNSSGAASVILNEVTKANRSQLQGYTEVLGGSANVILTNPYGITCDGCGFINTPRVTLSTGAAQINNGVVSGFEVAEGSVTVEGLGLDATRQSYFDIIARTSEVNAQINAQELNIITGKNRVDYQSNNVTKRASEGGRPALAIDSSSLGGMYAGRIALIATEDGVGVNVGNIAVSQGDLTIGADGKITLADTSARQSIQVTSREDVALSGIQSAGHNITIKANRLTANQSQSVAGQNMEMDIQSMTLSDATVEASQLASNAEQIILDNQSGLKTQVTNLSKLHSLDNDGTISSTHKLDVFGEQVTLSGSGSIETHQMDINSADLAIETRLHAQNLAVDNKGVLNVSSLAKINVSDTAQLATQSLNQQGKVLTTNALNIKASDSVSNSGEVQAEELVIDTKKMNSTGMLIANQSMTLKAENAILTGNVGASDIDVASDQLVIAGAIQANDTLDVVAQSANLKGTISSQNAMTISGDTLTQSGTLYSGSDLMLTQTDSVTLKGNVDAKGELEISTDTLDLQNRLVSDKSITLAAQNTTSSGLISATQSLVINSDSLSQTGDMFSGENLSIDARNVMLGGQVAADSGLSVQASDLLTISSTASVYGANQVDIYADSLRYKGEMLHSGGDLNLTLASELITDKDITADGDLILLASSLNNSGEISADGRAQVSLTGSLSNLSTGVISGQNTDIYAINVTNHGTLQALDALGLTANSLTNHGAMIVLGDATTHLRGTLTNHGVIYAGDDGYLYADAINNYSDIVTQKNLVMAKNASQARSTKLLNSSATIESLEGDISIFADTVSNKRTTLLTRVVETMDKTSQFSEKFEAKNTAYEPEYEYEKEIKSRTDGSNNRTIRHYTLISPDTLSVAVKEEGTQLVDASDASRIIASKKLSIVASRVQNNASQIAGQDLEINASSLNNAGYAFDKYTTYYDYVLPDNVFRVYAKNWRGRDFYRTGIRKVKTGNTAKLNSSITATGDVTLNVANTINNSTIQSEASRVLPSGSSQTTKGTSTVTGQVDTANTVNIDDLVVTLPTFNSVPYPDYRLPTNPNGLFIYSKEPKSKYLIETNPLLTDLSRYLGSDYFQSKVGISLEDDITFLGDAFYDTRVITQAIFEQTGRRYLNQSVGSDLEQMQTLMDAAAQAKSSLNLTVGISLMPEQVALLQNDILWYEKVEVDGHSVLAPKLYLAKVTQDSLSNGALIAGNNAEISGGEIKNSGQVLAANTLSLTSDREILNDGGTLTAASDVVLKAEGDIFNHSGVISGDNVTLGSQKGSIINKTLNEQIEYDKNALQTFVGENASIVATGSMSLTASEDIISQSAEMHSVDNMSLEAGNNVTLTVNEEKYHNWAYGSNDIKETQTIINKGSSIVSGRSLIVKAGENVHLTNAKILAQGNAEINAGNNLVIDTGLDEHSTYVQQGRRTEISHSKTHQASTLSGDNVQLSSGNDLVLSGSSIAAKQNASFNSKGDISILAVNDSNYLYSQEKKKKSFGRSKVTIKESLNETVKGAEINSSGDIVIKAQANQVARVAGGDGDIQLMGSELNADGSVTLSADGDLILASQQYKEFAREETIKKGFGGLSGEYKGSIDDATLLEGSYTIAAKNIDILAARDIGVLASDVTAGGNVNLDALDEVFISSEKALKQSKEWSEKYSFFKGGSIFEMESQRGGELTSDAQASHIQSDGDMSINSGSMAIVGSELTSENNILLRADTGSIDILSAESSSETYSDHEKLTVGFADLGEVVSVEGGQIRISLGQGTYDKVDNKTDQTTHTSSSITAGEHIIVHAESDVMVSGSDLLANTNQNDNGDISLSGRNITIKEAKETSIAETEEVHGSAEVSLVVQHQAAEVVKAAQALEKSSKALKKAEKDYKQYKKQLSSLENTLATLKEELKQDQPGVTFEDVEELTDLIAEVKSDETWYVTGIALASADVASKTTLLVQQKAAAAQSSGSYGFNAGLHLDIEASKSNNVSSQMSSVASHVEGQNIIINAGSDKGNLATIQGANLNSSDSISISANEVNIRASQESKNSKSNTESGSINTSLTVYGASSGLNLNSNLSRNESRTASTTYTNSTLNANEITISSGNDTNIQGANVRAEDSLTMNVGGNLNVVSVQDRHTSSHKGAGISAGLSLSGDEMPSDGGALQNMKGAGETTGASGGFNVSNGRTSIKETVLSSLAGNKVNISVEGNTDIKGAVIAATDSEGKDTQNLTLSTGSLTYNDLSNTRYSQNQSGGISSSVGIQNGEVNSTYNSSNLQYKNESGYSKSKTLTTIGQGELNIQDSENSDDTTALNRDTEHTEKDLFTVDRKQGDIDVTVDHRLLTEEGRKAIKEDVKRTHLAGNAIADVVTDESVEVSDTFEHMDVLQKELDIQKKIALENPEAAQILNNLDLANAEAKQYATEVYLQAYSDVMGVTIDEARVVAFKGGAKGNYLVQNGKTTVELNDAETANGADAANTIVHEGTHAAINQGRIGDKGEFEEQYAGLVGNYAESSFKFALENYGLGEYKSGDVNQHIGNDSSPLIWLNNINSAIQHNTPGVTVDNRFLSKREYELANTLAAESNGKYTAEEIRNVMRHTKAQESEKYDSGVSPYFVDTSKVDDKSFVDSSEGKLIVAQDGTGKGRYIVQDIGSIPLDESAKQYLLDQDLGYSFFKVPETKAVEVDFLTGKPINSQNGTYQVSHTIDGKSYVVDYHSCATPECVATNSNMVQNAASDAFIDATSAKALDDASSLGNGVLLITPQGHAIKNSVEGLSLVAGAVEAKLKDEIGKEVINSLIQKAAGKRMADKLGDNISEKANVILDEVGIYDAIVEPIPEDSSIGGDKK